MMKEQDELKILFVSSEVVPFVKTGGLADVAGFLPREIKNQGHDIRVVMPEYTGQIDEQYLSQTEHITDFRTDVAWRDEYVGINKLENKGVPTYFVDNKQMFNRPNLYENPDKHVQFAYFCRAVIEMLPKIDFQPDIIHCNDWQTGPLSAMLKNQYQMYDFYKDIRTIYTIHNLRYQGRFGLDILDDTLALSSDLLPKIEDDDQVNYMKTGISFADAVNTVSRMYAGEIQTPEFGEGLDYVLRYRKHDLYGIVNGIDYEEYDPTTDDRIYANFSADDLAGKQENKLRLQQEMGLPQEPDIPMISIISRLVPQKGLDLIQEVIDELLQEDIQFVMLGTGNQEYEDMFRRIAEQYPDKVATNITYDADLAQKIYASSDMFLMPSQFEPCGLGQLFSLRYGTIPIVRETGGLQDTIQSYNEQTKEGNGFSFSSYNADDMLYTIKRALDYYNNQQEVWERLVKKAIKSDYSWHQSAQEYINLYKKIKKY
ncbi:MAG: glycogen synthase GlgA [Bacillota bacterium]